MNVKQQAKRGRPCPLELADAARARAEEIGDRRTAKEIGMGRATLSRALAGQLLAEGSIALLERRFPDAVRPGPRAAS